MNRHRVRILSLLATTVALIGCGGPAELPQRPNIVLLLVDTLRADRMSLYGYERETTPELDRLAEDAVVFERAFSQAGCTFPSVNSLLTSRYPQRFVARKPRRLGFGEDDRTLARILSEHGYSTAAVSASRIVRKSPSRYNPHGGFEAGFDSFDESCERKRADCVNQAALTWLDGRLDGRGEADERPFFLYLHYMEPHAPYRPPRDFERRWAKRPMRNRMIRQGYLKPIKESLYDGSERPVLGEEVEFLRDLYDEEIRFVDAKLAELVVELDRRGLGDDTVVVLASDHGEELLEHGHIAHCRDLAFDTLVATPLMIRFPAGARRGRPERPVGSPVQNLDLVPTLLDYAGLEHDPEAFEGVSLRPLIDRGKPGRELAYSAQGTTRAITDGRYQLLLDLAAGTGQLLDLDTPPAEQTDLSSRLPEVREELGEALLAWIESIEGTGAEAVGAARELEAQLEAVGYL